jgi:hypothetical protein
VLSLNNHLLTERHTVHALVMCDNRLYPVWLNNIAGSRRVAIVVAQQPAQTITAPYLAAVAPKV